MEEHNCKSLLETKKSPLGFKNDVFNKIEKLPVAQYQSSLKEYCCIQALGYFLH